MKKEFCCSFYEEEHKSISSLIEFWVDAYKEEGIRQRCLLLAPRSEIVFRDTDGIVHFKYIILNRRISDGYDFYCTKDRENYFLKDSDFIKKVTKLQEIGEYCLEFNYFPRKKTDKESLLFQQQYDLLDTYDLSSNEVVDIQISKEALYNLCHHLDDKFELTICERKKYYKERISELRKRFKNLK